MNRYSSIIQLGFSAYIVDTWLSTDKTPGLQECLKEFHEALFITMGAKLKTMEAVRYTTKGAHFKPEILNSIEKASIHLSGKYDMDSPLALGTIQCILINCHEMSGKDMKRRFKVLQGMIENCISLIDYNIFNETDDTTFIEISEYLNGL